MNARLKIGLSLALLIAAVLVTVIAVVVRPRFLSSSSSRESPLPAGAWLVAGPIPGNGDNALYKDYLSGDGEDKTRPREGEIAAWRWKGLVRWQTASPAANDSINLAAIWPAASLQSIAYLYTELESDRDQYAVATIGSGTDTQLRLNGEILYETRVFRKAEPDKDTVVLPLQKGTNSVLIKIQRGLSWSFQWTVTVPAGPLFANNRETIIPDFRAGQPASAWGQVEVTNASGSRLSDVAVEVLEDELVSASRSEVTSLEPEEVRRIPVWIASRSSLAAGASPKVRIRVTSGRDAYSFEVAPRLRASNTSFVTTYRSMLDGSVQPFSVLLPPSFDKRTTYALILLLHGSHVTSWGGNIISYSPKDWAIQVAVHDRGNNDYRGVGEVDIDEVLAEVGKRYLIDPNRMYLSGHSMGGYGTWFLGTRYPDRWAAISPQTAATDLSLDGAATGEVVGRAQRGFRARLLESWSPIRFVENLLHVPAYIMHGARDTKLTVAHSRNMSARLEGLGYQHVYDENPEGEHWWGSRPEHQGTLCVDKPEISEFLRKYRRVTNPKLVVYTTDNLRYRRAYWVTIDELDALNQMASIRAEVMSPQSLEVRVDNIERFTLELNERLISVNDRLTVSVNGRTAFEGSLPGTMRLTLRRESDGSFVKVDDQPERDSRSNNLRRRAGRTATQDLADDEGPDLTLTGGRRDYRRQPSEALSKTESLSGPVIDAFNEPFILVVGSTGEGERDEAMKQSSRRAALVFAHDWMTRCDGIARVKTDAEVTPDDIASSNLILFGNTATNSLINAINAQLPIRFGPAGLMRGERPIPSDEGGMVMIRPNPLNESRYVVIVGATTPGGMLTASRLRLTDLPDYVVFDRNALTGKRVSFLSGGFFDKHWQLP
jgi:pimeloyl-ACP methyl ester carboxylesterase